MAFSVSSATASPWEERCQQATPPRPRGYGKGPPELGDSWAGCLYPFFSPPLHYPLPAEARDSQNKLCPPMVSLICSLGCCQLSLNQFSKTGLSESPRALA